MPDGLKFRTLLNLCAYRRTSRGKPAARIVDARIGSAPDVRKVIMVHQPDCRLQLRFGFCRLVQDAASNSA